MYLQVTYTKHKKKKIFANFENCLNGIFGNHLIANGS